MFRHCNWFVLLLLCMHADSAFAAPPELTAASRLQNAGVAPTVEGIREYLGKQVRNEVPQDIARLIAELGHEQYAVRERAMKSLAEANPPPFKALIAATRSDDAEVQWRARMLIVRIRLPNDPIMSAALELVALKKLAIGVPLLLKIHQQAETPEAKAEVLPALFAILQETDRPTIEALARHAEKPSQNLGRILLAKLDKKEIPVDLAGSFDAVTLKSGGVAGGGPNLIAGWEFKTKSDLTVTHLGILDRQMDGLSVAHEVAIWDLEDRTTPLVLETIPAGEEAKLVGEHRLVSVAPLKLKADRRYAIVAHYSDPSDGAVSLINPEGLTIKYAPHLEVLGRRYTFPHKAMAFPDNIQMGVEHATHGPTFRFESVEVGK